MSENAQKPNRSAFPTVVAILGAFLIFYFLISFTYVDSSDTTDEPALERPSLAEQKALEQSKLTGYTVIDAAAGKVRLPIERAKDLVVSENSN